MSADLFDLLGNNPDTSGTWTGPSALTGGHLGTFTPGSNTGGTYTYTVNSAKGICTSATATGQVNITVVPPPTIASTTQAFCSTDYQVTTP